MKNLLKLEEFFLFGLALFLFSQLEYGWGTYALLFLAPDLSMLGYLINPQHHPQLNGGGNEAVLTPFIDALKARPSIHTTRKLFVIIG